jgi:mono/diheme cytochrome c family protein
MLAGSLTTVVACGFAVVVWVKTSDGMSARATPPAAETWLARSARRFAMSAEARQRPNPVPNTPEVTAGGLAHWADHCASCHANNGSGETPMGEGLYPPAPDMRQAATQDMTDGELFYVIENGVRLTGMPAWGGPGHDGVDSWKLVHFIRHLPNLSFEERREMERLNPKGPDDIEEERQQQEFLRGEDTHETHQHSH